MRPPTWLRRPLRVALVACLVLGALPPAARTAEPPTDTAAERLRQIKSMQRELLMRGFRNKVARLRASRFKPPDYRIPPKHDRRIFPEPGAGFRARPETAMNPRAARAGFGTPEAAGIPGGRRTLTDPNVRVSNPAVDTSNEGQTEPSLAAWRQYVVAAWNDGEGFVSGGSSQGYAVSSDSGATFLDLGVPPAPSGGTWTWSSDPIVTVNEKTGDFYYCALANFSPFRSAVGMVRGTFTGPTFNWDPSGPHVVGDVSAIGGLLDKCWIAADSSTGNLYVSYTEFIRAPEAAHITFQRSINNGVNWSAPVRLSPPSASGLVQGSRPCVGPNGRLYVVWKEIGATDQDFFRMRVSTDGGVTFGAQSTVAGHFDNFGTGAPGFNRERGITFPAIAVDRTLGPRRGRVYVAWNEATNWYDAIPTLGTTGTTAESESNDTPGSADAFTPGQRVTGSFTNNDVDYFQFNAVQGLTYVFWCDQVPAAFYRMYVVCTDGTTSLARAGDTEAPEGNQSLLVWTAPSTGIYYLRMVHLSLSTGAYRVISGIDPPGSGRARDHRDIFVASSPDGASWSVPVRVNDDPPYFDNWLPEVAVDAAGSVYALWYDWRDAPTSKCGGVSHVYLSRSDDGGSTWGLLGPASDVQTAWSSVSTNIIPNQGDYLALFANERGVYPCWTDGRLGNPDVMAAPLRAFQTQVVVQSVAADTNHVFVTWRATKQGSPASVSVGVYRRTGATAFDSVGTIASNAAGRMTYDDNDVTAAGFKYEYELRLAEAGVSRFVGQVVVFAPVGPALALGAPYPNPTPRDVIIPIALPNGDPAKLTLLDIAGREVRSQDVGLGAGFHSIPLGPGDALRPGIYIIRLTQAGASVTRRVTVVP